MGTPKRPALAAALLLLFAAAACSSQKDGRKYDLKTEELHIETAAGAVTVSAELAIKQEERNYGFMNRTTIPAGTGMLFIFESDQILRFWMKNTPHPLSIAYIDSSGTISDILDMQPFSLADVSSSRSVRFALEVPQGWFTTAGVQCGDRVTRSDGSPLRSIR